MERDHGDAHSYTLGRLKQLRAIHKREITSIGDAAKNLRDEAEIFTDILPGYRIKELTEAEKGQMQSKEVRSLQSVEQTILFYYRKFLGNLISLAHKKSDDTQMVAVSCLCEMLPVAQDFNFGSAVIDIIVDRANSRVPKLANMCIACVRDLLSAPTPTEATLSCLQCISDSVKDRGAAVNHRLIQSLMFVRLRVIDIHARDISREKKQLQADKKKDKELAKIASHGEAKLSRVQQAQLQTNMLNKVITTYLRAIEAAKKSTSRYRQSMVLAPTMEGLAKFANLIDHSLFDLLLQAIQDVMESEATTTATKLNGIITVATLAQQIQIQSNAIDGGAGGMSIDIAPYYEYLFQALPKAFDVSSHHDDASRVDKAVEDELETPNDDATTAVSFYAPGKGKGNKTDPARNTLKERQERSSLALTACKLLLLVPKKVSLKRVAAFCRKLEILSVQCPPNISASVMGFVHSCLLKYPSIGVIHDGGDDTLGAAYDPHAESPDHVNALGSLSWETTLLRKSYHPFVREYASTVLRNHKGIMSGGQKSKFGAHTGVLMGFSFEKGIRKYDVSSGDFNPLPAEQNKRMDRAMLKKRSEVHRLAKIELKRASEDSSSAPVKRLKAPAPAMEFA
eukprot:TRINITY_DN8790_c0_g1_i1.p1 TRINITY_DN8790_c0_g1~~TRINITY_DN8790_c0_g1_i1.p1  ORF type:complete len:624 (+),score=94.70 TRINITY_DN8790_c0_g1_i1:43-1914(+)